ncbi:MAG: S41 family peptidase [Planctomycetaceae bacterium]
MFASRKAASHYLAAILLALVPTAMQIAKGQEASPLAPAQTESLAQVLQLGDKLESERNWAGALTHYEEALRQFPGQKKLSQRLTLARTHYDVARRYSDASYVAALGTFTEKDVSAIYEEVLLKIQSHYVSQPQWGTLLQRGVTTLAVATTEPAYQKRHLAKVSKEQQEAFHSELESIRVPAEITDRRQAREFAESLSVQLKNKFGVSVQSTMMEFVCGATGSLDDYSGFLSSSQIDEVYSQIEGNFVGLGVELKPEPSGLLIVNVINGGPASEGKIRAGDRITSVDGKTPKQTSPDVLADMLRGEEGSKVSVGVKSAQGTERTIVLTRRRVEVPSVDEVKIVDRDYGIGYFKLTSFQKTTGRDVDAALWKLHDQGMKSLIIDLRGNPGGLLKAAVDVADKFVMEGMIVATRGRSPREDFDHRGQVAGTWRVPLVVLIDRDSASASEIFAGAIRDHRRGTIVGERSFGKGSVQGIFPLASANVGVRLTTAKWFTPSGKAINGEGVSPDVVVVAADRQTGARPMSEQVAESEGTLEDPFLKAGLQVAKSNLSRR